jgi:hypothetical protein
MELVIQNNSQPPPNPPPGGGDQDRIAALEAQIESLTQRKCRAAAQEAGTAQSRDEQG